MKTRCFLMLLLPFALFAQSGAVLQTAPVGRGVVLSVRTVTSESPGVGGAILGGTAGGVIGHQFGKGNGKAAATVVGAVLGAVAGASIEQNASRQSGTEIVVQTENGSTFSVIQASNEILSPGDKVYLIPEANGATRVQRAPDDLEMRSAGLAQVPQPMQPAPQVEGMQEIIVAEAPPPPRSEIIVSRPGDDFVWIAGYYEIRGHNRYWVSGHWIRPPRQGVVWISPRWEQRGRNYAFIPGYWGDAPGFQVVNRYSPRRPEVVIMNAPPPLHREYRNEHARPSRNHIWIDGYWSVRGGRHSWVAGYWTVPPRHNAMWVKPRWDHRGREYVFVDGYWR